MSLNVNQVHPKKACTHCGTTFHPVEPEAEFCCSGCAFVHDMITNEGLDQFYDLKGNATTRPVQNLAFEQRDYHWLIEKASIAETNADLTARLEVGLDGASCAGCVWLIDRLYGKTPGALQIFTDPVNGRLEMTWENGALDIESFAQTLQHYGYKLCPLDSKRAGHGGRDPLLNRLGICAAFAMNSMAFTLPKYLGMPSDFMFASLFQLITALSATLALAVGGSYFIKRAWQALSEGVLHVDVPIALGLVFAYLGSLIGWLLGMESMLYFDFVAIFVFLMLGGRWLQEQVLRRNQRRLFEDDAVPKEVLVDGKPLSLAELRSGQSYEVKPGQVIPVASRILSETALLGMEWIQGESDTREQRSGSVAASGAVYRGNQPVLLEAREAWNDSLLHRLTKKQGTHKEHPLLQTVLRVYLWVILAIGVLGGVAWAVKTGDAARGLQVTLSIFVISCPCALGVAVPLADEFAASAARRLGVFVQQLSFWSRLRSVRQLLFDKTGTLTLDSPQLIDTTPLDALDAEARQTLATLACASAHPISRSLTEHLAAQLGIRGSTHDCEVEEIPGQGLRYSDPQGQVWTLSRPTVALTADVEFRKDADLLATFKFADTLRDGAVKEVEALRQAGLQSFILSGDREAKVADLAKLLGLSPSHWSAQMTPDEKASMVAELDHKDTLYIGDGANDSLAFDHAYATATPAFDRNVLSSKADCYFVTRGLTFLSPLIRLAHRRHHVIRSVFTFAVVYNALAVAVCLTGQMNPLLAAILMPLSSLATTAMVVLGFEQWRSA